MPANCLLQPYVAGTQAAVTAPLLDPRPERANRRRFRREEVRRLRHANSLYVSGGAIPSRGWVLLRRADYDDLNPLATDLQLTLADTAGNTPPLTLYNLAVVRADCVSRGLAGDPDAAYLVELCDPQGLLANRWFRFPTESSYNLRAPAYPTPDPRDPGGFYSTSLNAGSPWTWSALVGDLWGQMAFALGAYPGLPAGFAPAETAEGWSFPGAGAWEALNHVLDHLGLTVATDLTNPTAPFSIAQYGAPDAAFAALQAKYARLLEDDLESPGFGAGRVPGSVQVFFHRRNRYYGTEENVRRDSLQWTMTPSYNVLVTATAAGFPQFAGAPGRGYVWSELTVRFDEDGNPLAADAATASAAAAAEAAAFYGKVYRGSAGYLRQTYAGLVPFATGSLCDGVHWHQDYAAGRLGWRTEVVRGVDPPWPGMVADEGAE